VLSCRIVCSQIVTQPETPTDSLRINSLWKQLLGETRTRILLVYIVLMVLVTCASVPIFVGLFFASVDRRVKTDLAEDLADFNEAYAAWEAPPNQFVADL